MSPPSVVSVSLSTVAPLIRSLASPSRYVREWEKGAVHWRCRELLSSCLVVEDKKWTSFNLVFVSALGCLWFLTDDSWIKLWFILALQLIPELIPFDSFEFWSISALTRSISSLINPYLTSCAIERGFVVSKWHLNWFNKTALKLVQPQIFMKLQ